VSSVGAGHRNDGTKMQCVMLRLSRNTDSSDGAERALGVGVGTGVGAAVGVGVGVERSSGDRRATEGVRGIGRRPWVGAASAPGRARVARSWPAVRNVFSRKSKSEGQTMAEASMAAVGKSGGGRNESASTFHVRRDS
jgi:hypothetical protein